ncbi:hypothetical protein [Rickettsiella massiliensis]|uniref:hypothetical protein n=1 Tax=Rickettsiella massiliensis TaxID=676517 RepID=UPI00029A81F7|nr:hypothetical protein [Rickettsiella massiliensis]
MNPEKFIFNTDKYLFLQNIIAHVWSEQKIYMVIYQTNLKQFDKYLIDLNCKLQEVFANQTVYTERF